MKDQKTLLRVAAAVFCVLVAFAVYVAFEGGFGMKKTNKVPVSDISETPLILGMFSLEVQGRLDYKQLKTHNLPIVVDYGSVSCIPCRQMAPILSKLNREYENRAFIKFVDIRKNPDAVVGIPIRLIPSQVFITAQGTPFIPSKELAAKIHFLHVESMDSHLPSYTVHEGALTEEQLREILKEMGV